jgi:hypothetical protein
LYQKKTQYLDNFDNGLPQAKNDCSFLSSLIFEIDLALLVGCEFPLHSSDLAVNKNSYQNISNLPMKKAG